MFWIDLPIIITGAMIFMRVGGVFFALPIFGDAPTPVRVRILLSVAVTLCLLPMVPTNWLRDPNPEFMALCLLLIRELFIGVVIGYLSRLVFDGFIMAANVVGYQMGFGTSNLFLPDAAMSLDGFAAFHRILVMLIFLSLSLHHIFVQAIVDTFYFIPAGGAVLNGGLLKTLITLSGKVLSVAVQLSAPIIVALLFSMAALGLLARAVPQLNVFTVSFPVNFFLGLLVYIATLPFLPSWMRDQIMAAQQDIFTAVRHMTQ